MNYQQYQPHTFFQMLQTINKGSLFRRITKELSVALTLLIEQNKGNLSSDDRAILKAMGSFLGQMTLYRNKPVLTKHFNYRKLLSCAPYAILVIAKILEWSKDNEVFKLENPWMKNLLDALDKANAKCTHTMFNYEISLLFQALKYSNDHEQPKKVVAPVVEPSTSASSPSRR